MSDTRAVGADSPTQRQTRQRHWLYLVPVVLFAGLALALWLGLSRDPSLLPSALIGSPAPVTALPAVDGHGPAFTNDDFLGQVTLVNVFASWCTSCRYEHPLLMEIAGNGDVAVFGLAYKDDPVDSAAWLDRYGNPYAATAADTNGRAGIDWGVYGVPETFLVGPNGTVAYKHIGPLTIENWRDTLAPMIAELTP